MFVSIGFWLIRMLEVSNLYFDYEDRPILKGLSFALKPQQLLHVRGANGAGKTSLLKLLAGLTWPKQGEIKYLGASIYTDLVSYQQNIAYVGHKFGHSALLTVYENLSSIATPQKYHLIDNYLHVFGLDAFRDELCSLLSAGQRRRVSLLRLLLTDKSLWLLDEPLTALDHAAIEFISQHFLAHIKAGGAIVLSSHQAIPIKDSAYQELILS